MNMRLLLVLFTVSTAITLVSLEECDLNEMDENAAKMAIVGSIVMPVPETSEEIAKYCAVHKESCLGIKRYASRCLDPLRARVIGVYANSGMNLNKKYCKNGTAPDLEPFIPCLKKAQLGHHHCMLTLITEVEAIIDDDESEKVGRSCCRFGDYKQCVYDESIKAGCTEDESEFSAELVEAIIWDTMDMVCLGYETGSSICKEFPRPDISDRKNKAQSIALPILGVMNFFLR